MTRMVLSVLATAAAATAAAATTGQDPLSAWLYNLRLPLPDAHGVVDGVDVSLTGATCTHAQIKTLAATGSQTTISINTKDAALDCSFQWAYKATHVKGNGRASASLVVKKASTTISLDASQETRPRPISSSLRNCSRVVRSAKRSRSSSRSPACCGFPRSRACGFRTSCSLRTRGFGAFRSSC